MAMYLSFINGRIKRVLALMASTGVTDANKIVMTGNDGYLHPSIMPPGARERAVMVASEALAGGDFVNFFDDTGTIKMRKADATAPGKEANGFVLQSATLGQSIDVYTDGYNTSLIGLTVGATYYLDTVAGGITATPLTADGNVSQSVGIATSATELDVAIQPIGSTVVL